MRTIRLSIIMATYNSEKTIDKSLKSIRGQDISQESVEILIIDGGSTDKTIEIAKKYHAIIIDNPYRLPEPAKRIGMKNASGKYILIMDSDEVLPKKNVLRKRMAFMDEHDELMCLLGGHTAPKKLHACGCYLSNVGDPFSAFVYNWYIGGNIGLITKHNVYKGDDAYIGKFDLNDTYPIGDSVTLFRREYVYDNYFELLGSENTATIFGLIIRDTGLVGHIKDDFVIHYTKSDVKTYLKKIKFRIINNIYDKNGSGYSAISKSNTKLRYRKYLYPFYCILIPWPIMDGIRMALHYKNSVFLLHPFFAWYVLCEILLQYIKKIFGGKSQNKQYG